MLEGEEQAPAPRAAFILPEPLGDALTGCAGVKGDGSRAKQGSRAAGAIPGSVWGWGGQAGWGKGEDGSFLLVRLSSLLLNLGNPSSPSLPQLPLGKIPMPSPLGFAGPLPPLQPLLQPQGELTAALIYPAGMWVSPALLLHPSGRDGEGKGEFFYSELSDGELGSELL